MRHWLTGLLTALLLFSAPGFADAQKETIGFAGADDYYRRAAAKPLLADIRVPALALNALNDPFVPADSLPRASEVGRHVTLWQPREGGHVGFPEGALPPGDVFWLPRAVGGWLLEHA